ncbi:MAG: hypothetical protein JNL19_07160 [Burkholderiales bacterium]|nr:hypothetical protein [Burkholderiales bacterium]
MLKPFTALFAAVLTSAVAFAQVGPLKPPQPNGPPKVDPKLLTQPIKPDLSVKIQDVKMSCPQTAGESPFKITLQVRNNGGKFADAAVTGGKSMSIEIKVDDEPTVLGGGFWAKAAVDAINSPAGWVSTQSGPMILNFTKGAGKPDPTRLATPKTVAVTVFVDSNNVVDELNENNNKDQTMFTIPANVCK